MARKSHWQGGPIRLHPVEDGHQGLVAEQSSQRRHLAVRYGDQLSESAGVELRSQARLLDELARQSRCGLKAAGPAGGSPASVITRSALKLCPALMGVTHRAQARM